MKKAIFSMAAATLAVAFTACSDTGTSTANGDTAAMNNNAVVNTAPTTDTNTTSTASVGNYAAMADTIESNSSKGYYLNPKTGKAYKSLKVDRSTGRVTSDAGEDVWRYVDNRNMGVYGGDNWSRMGEAKMEGEKMMYKGDDEKWVNYDSRWMKDDEDMVKKYKVSDGGNKQKMVTEGGDKIKVKTDEEGNTKVKVNDEKVKMDKDGNIKKD